MLPVIATQAPDGHYGGPLIARTASNCLPCLSSGAASALFTLEVEEGKTQISRINTETHHEHCNGDAAAV